MSTAYHNRTYDIVHDLDNKLRQLKLSACFNDVDLDMLLGSTEGSQEPLFLNQEDINQSETSLHHASAANSDRRCIGLCNPSCLDCEVIRHTGALNDYTDFSFERPYFKENGSSMPKSISLPSHHAPNPFPELIKTSAAGTASYSPSPCASPCTGREWEGEEGGSTSRASPERGMYEGALTEVTKNTWSPATYTKTMALFHLEDRSYKVVSLDESTTCSCVTRYLAEKIGGKPDKNWAIIEYISNFNLERSIEDHELIAPIYKNWGPQFEQNKFYFKKDFRKYEVFQNPTQFFPPHMLATKDGSPGLSNKCDRNTNIFLQNLFSSNSRMPDIQGYLHMKEGKKSWKKFYFVLRHSGLYYSTKGTSKDPRHLVAFSQLTGVNVYLANNAKKTFSAPNNCCFCLKSPYNVTDAKELKLLCAEDEQSRACWVTGMRLIKYGSQLRENFKSAIKYENNLLCDESKREPIKPGFVPKSRVAMDFTGTAGRVVDDPNEALGVAIEEGFNWRKKVSRPSRSPLSQSPSVGAGFLSDNPLRSTKGLSAGVHMTQPWFHSGISREEAVTLIHEDGMVDGVYLIRESHTIPGAYVLSLAHNHTVKHCTIKKGEEDGYQFFSLDGGHTKFTDLYQLVEFYSLNANGLPTRLTHYVTRLPVPHAHVTDYVEDLGAEDYMKHRPK